LGRSFRIIKKDYLNIKMKIKIKMKMEKEKELKLKIAKIVKNQTKK